MIDAVEFKKVVEAYYNDFTQRYWDKEEGFKWKAVKAFSEKWDIDSSDFSAMLKAALKEVKPLLMGPNYFSSGMLGEFADAEPETVRQMFRDLYDESAELVWRFDNFKKQSIKLLSIIGKADKNHYQDEHAISIYLWLRYPAKYYIYKFTETQNMAELLKSQYKFVSGRYTEILSNWLPLYDEVTELLRHEDALLRKVRSYFTGDSYPDESLHTLTSDFAFYITRYYVKAQEKIAWWPSDYTPALSEAQWLSLLNDDSVFDESSRTLIKQFADIGGQATCTELAKKYGGEANAYNNASVLLAKRVQNATNCPVYEREDGNKCYWVVLYEGKKADKKADGVFIWKLRDELASAWDKYEMNQKSNPSIDKRYWMMSAKPTLWKVSTFPVGGVMDVSMFAPSGNKSRIYQHFLDARIGDSVILYESNPTKKIVAIGEIAGEQDGQRILIRKTEGLENPISFEELKESDELSKMEFFRVLRATIYQLTTDEYKFLMDMIREDNPLPATRPADKYDKKQFLQEVFMSEAQYDEIEAVLKRKKNIILQGAPGVGKTFAAKRLAYSIMGEKKDDHIYFVQFHQNYSYEDFVEGYRPSESGFIIKDGVFKKFCITAKNHPKDPYFFIIDEINRGNLSKIFGELLMLIEANYRGHEAALANTGEPFTVPENLYIIGMMNTADRSLAMIDYALRRRFSFIDMEPGFDTDGFKEYMSSKGSSTMKALVEEVKQLNVDIKEKLGKGFCIGHSYFVFDEPCSDELLKSIVNYDILPMLAEYWFDDEEQYEMWASRLNGVFENGSK